MKTYLKIMELSVIPMLFSGLAVLLASNLGADKDSAQPLNSAPRAEYTAQLLRDPFTSPFEALITAADKLPVSTGLSHLKVQGMVWDSKMPQAIINNTVVKVGELIEGAKILDIQKEGVYVLYQEKRYILRPNIAK